MMSNDLRFVSLGCRGWDHSEGNAVDLAIANAQSKKQKWSVVKPVVQAVVQDAVDHFHSCQAFKSVEWYTPPKPVYRNIPKVLGQPTRLSARAQKWAASRSLEFHRLCLRNKSIAAASVLVSITDSLHRKLAFWLCPLKHRYNGMLLKMEPSLVGSGVDVQVSIPTVHKSTPDMFAEYYEQCVEQHAHLLVTLQFVTWGKTGSTLEIPDTDEGDEPLVDLEMVLDDSFPKQKGKRPANAKMKK